jgi:hypothetical protein
VKLIKHKENFAKLECFENATDKTRVKVTLRLTASRSVLLSSPVARDQILVSVLHLLSCSCNNIYSEFRLTAKFLRQRKCRQGCPKVPFCLPETEEEIEGSCWHPASSYSWYRAPLGRMTIYLFTCKTIVSVFFFLELPFDQRRGWSF